MNCPTCHVDNRIERRFCHSCGDKLTPNVCPGCSFVNFPGEKFCGGCGTQVDQAVVLATPAAPGASPRPAPVAVEDAERRQLTVMFVDLVGSTALSGELDAEDLRDVIVDFQDACAAQIARFDGFIARYMGDGMLVYFGYPRAREDSAARAVGAGLAIVDAVSALTDLPITPQVRVGIATGHVVVGDIIGEGASEERAVVGETPNLAARLQGLAAPNTVVLSDRTRRLAGQRFEVEDLGEHVLKGFSSEIRAWRAVGRQQTVSRYEADRTHEAPLVGREFEVALLADRWSSAARGDGRVVVLSGEAGSGKTRLVTALIDRMQGIHAKCFQCAPHRSSTPLYPFIDAITKASTFGLDDSPEERVARLTEMVGTWSTNDEDLPALAALTGIDVGVELTGGPGEQLQAMQNALWRATASKLAEQPTLIVFEDVQWADPTTLDFIASIVQRASAEQLMVVVTHRADFEPSWKRAGHLTSLSLGKLATEHSRQLVTGLAEGSDLHPDTIEQIVHRGDGVPTFLTELTRAVLASETAVVPETLHDSLASQLDGVGDARDVAQVAAVIGREFSLALLYRVYGGSEHTLRQGVDALVSAGLIAAPGLGGGDQHTFRLALLRDVAYGSLLKKSQRAFHDRIADVLVGELPQAAATDPEGVASHLCRAGRPREACSWWRRAARRDGDHGAHEEAISHLSEALRAMEGVPPEDAEAAAQTVPIRVDLALALRLVQRHDAAFAYLETAIEQAMRHDLGPDLSRAYFARGNVCFQTGRPQECQDSHQMALDVAKRFSDIEGEVRALGGLADAAVLLGNFPEAAKIGRLCVAMADKHGFPRIAAANASVTGWTSLYSLQIEEAKASALDAIERGKAVGNQRSLMGAYNVCMQIYALIGDLDNARKYVALRTEAGAAQDEVGMVMAQGLISRLTGDREATATFIRDRYADETLKQDAPLKAWLVATTTGDYEQLLEELLEKYRTQKGKQLLLWSGMTALEGLVYRRDWDNAGRFSEVLRDQLGDAVAPMLAIWLDATDAMLARIGDPEDRAALAALEAISSRVEAVPLALLGEHIRGVIDAPEPLREAWTTRA